MARQQAPEVLIQKALVHHQAGELKKAEKLYRSVLKRHPQQVDGLQLFGTLCLQKGDHKSAIKNIRKAITLKPDVSSFHNNLAEALAAQGYLQQALPSYDKAIVLDPFNAEAYNNKGATLKALGEYPQAIVCYQKACELKPNYPEALANLGNVHRIQGLLPEAARYFQQCLAIAPQYVHASAGLADTYEDQGDLDLALESAEQALKIDPNHPLATAIIHNVKAQLAAKDGNYPEAFKNYQTGNQALACTPEARALQKRPSPDSFASIEANHRWLKAEKFRQWSQVSTEGQRPSPVFLIGFPRSGTTLLEQVLNSHSNIESLEEKPTLIDIQRDFLGSSQKLAALKDLGSEDVENYQRKYWKGVQNYLPHLMQEATFIDKMPLNSIYIAAIHRIFPNAKYIISLRDPRDVCLSCFMRKFSLNTAMVNFLSMDQTVKYYQKVMGLLLAYEKTLPLQSYRLRYEDLIVDLEGSVNGLLSFLDLQWQPQMLEYRQKAQQRTISTPSYQQVRKPLYQSASGRWRKYQKALGPYLPPLSPFAEAFGYPTE